MEKQVFQLSNPLARRNAARAIADAPDNYRVEIRPRTRSLDSNAKMWAMLADIAAQVKWPINGVLQALSAEDWKDILSASLSQENRIAQGVRGGFVMLGKRTSRMTVREMSELIEFMHAFGAEQNVVWSERVDAPEWIR